ncbi:hypothetical protein V6N12_048535 [Hibiscus sabdariffa]|uniref:RNase H type-1 domain-containing protein n=1 Tax=Hibiscus sabdariffa TaxID=183260 RepID=A0ABR2EHK4_9ROSI
MCKIRVAEIQSFYKPARHVITIFQFYRSFVLRSIAGLKEGLCRVSYVKIAVDIFIDAGWVGVTELVLESNSRMVVNWIENPIAQPRVWWETFLELDRATRLIGKLNCCHVERADNSMAALLAKEGANRINLFKAW